jgi:hypothetical protein
LRGCRRRGCTRQDELDHSAGSGRPSSPASTGTWRTRPPGIWICSDRIRRTRHRSPPGPPQLGRHRSCGTVRESPQVHQSRTHHPIPRPPGQAIGCNRWFCAGSYRRALQAEFARIQVLDRSLAGRVFFEEVIRDNLDAGRPDRVSLIFARHLIKTTRGGFGPGCSTTACSRRCTSTTSTPRSSSTTSSTAPFGPRPRSTTRATSGSAHGERAYSLRVHNAQAQGPA